MKAQVQELKQKAETTAQQMLNILYTEPIVLPLDIRLDPTILGPLV
jgi:hypothetical protein